VSNTIAANNNIPGSGIDINPTGSAAVAGVLSKVTANNNLGGIIVKGSATTGASLNVTIVDSVASNNTDVGIGVFGNTAAVMLRNVVASNNATGLEADTNAILRVAHSVVTGNVTGVFGGGTIQSYGDNNIDGNLNNNTGVLTPIAKH
jgi:hypothetical protein